MDEIQRLILQVKGEAELKELNRQLAESRAKMDQFIEAEKAGSIAAPQFEAAMRSQARVMKDLNDQVATVATTTGAGKSAKAGSLGYALMQTGYVVDDFVAGIGQQGLAGALANIQNNLPGLLQSLGAGAGLAGVLGIAGVGVAQLVRHWDDLKKLFSDGGLAQAAEQMKAFGVEAQKAADALDAQVKAAREQKDATQQATGAAVTAQTGGPDFDKVVNQVSGVTPHVAKEQSRLGGAASAAEADAKKIPATLDVEGRAVNPARTAADAKAKELRDQLDALNDTAKNAVDRAKQLVLRARNGDMAAYDELLATTTGDVHDSLAAADPRKAGLRGLAKDRAKKQISEAIGDFMNPVITGMKGKNAAAKQGGQQADILEGFNDAQKKDDDRGQAKDQKHAKGVDDRRLDRTEALRQQREQEHAATPQGKAEDAQKQMQALEQQANALGQDMQIGAGMGFDVSPMMEKMQGLQQQYAQQQQQMMIARQQMQGQVGGGQNSALPMYNGGSF